MWRRSAALFVDAAVVTGAVVGAYRLTGVAYVDLDGRVVLPHGWLALLGLWAAWVVYWSVFEALKAHATPGKAIFGVRVVSADGSPHVRTGRVLVRNVMRIPDVFLCAPAGLAVTLLSVGRRRPGDMAARTLVVRRAAAAPGAALATPWTPSPTDVGT
ncbi:MAG: RDD family protein [Acidimicrobiia bacterium]